MQASISLSFLVLALVASSPAAVHGQPGVHLLHAVGCVSTGCCPGPCVSCHVCLFISLSCSGGCSSKLIQPADSGTRSQTGYAPLRVLLIIRTSPCGTHALFSGVSVTRLLNARRAVQVVLAVARSNWTAHRTSA